MYHYTACGLDNIWLVNGYRTVDSPYGKAVEIDGIKALHEAIGATLVAKPTKLSGAEFRFLRKEMDYSQETLAQYFGVDVQTIANYEKKSTHPKLADAAIRSLYAQKLKNKTLLTAATSALLKVLSDVVSKERLELRETKGEWEAKTKARRKGTAAA